MLDERAVDGLTRYMFLSDQVLNADVTLVLGMSLWQRPLGVAQQIYQAGLSGVVVLTGGFNKKLKALEAETMLAGWVKSGMPTEHVLMEPRASNTLENMMFSRTLLESHGLFRADMTINVVTINYHMRRALVSLRAAMGPHVQVGVANYVSQYCDPGRWFSHPKGAALILQEAQKIKMYFPNMMTPCHFLV